MLKEIQGDILTGLDIRTCDHTLVLHGCNCFHTMNSGIARYLRAQFPVIYDIDCLSTVKGDQDKLGSYSRAQITHQFNILNCYTQYKYGTDQVNVDYTAIGKCFNRISYKFSSDIWKIRMPRIGCGLARGEWERVQELAESQLNEFDVEVYYLNG